MDWDLYRRENANWSAIREDMIGDYYPLTPYSLDHSTWLAWQYDRPDLGTGVVQAFRRPKSPFTAARFPLHGIDPGASYVVTNLDMPSETKTIKGKDLIDPGLEISLGMLPEAGICDLREAAMMRGEGSSWLGRSRFLQKRGSPMA
jgi:alpha-galactosidase